MSASNGPFHDMALLLEQRLQGVAALTEVPVMVDLQKDPASFAEQATGKQDGSGCCITILYEGYRIPDVNMSGPRVMARYIIRIYGLPFMKEVSETFVAAETAQAEVMKALHHWTPAGPHNFDECRLEPGGMEPNANFLIYEVPVEVPVQM